MTDHLPAEPPDGDHYALGIAHGYPACCVQYYCDLLSEGHDAPYEEDCRRRGTTITADWLADHTAEYVRCPQCRPAAGEIG